MQRRGFSNQSRPCSVYYILHDWRLFSVAAHQSEDLHGALLDTGYFEADSTSSLNPDRSSQGDLTGPTFEVEIRMQSSASSEMSTA